MEKSVKILLYVVLGVVVLHALFSIFSSPSQLNEALKEIKEVKADLKVVSDSLSSSKKQIGTILENINENQHRITLMKKEVEVLYNDYRKDDEISKRKRDSLEKIMDLEDRRRDSLVKELSKIGQ